MTTHQLVIGHGNVYAANKAPGRAVKAIRAAHTDSFGINEGNNILGRLRGVPGYRVTVSNAPGRPRETPILTKDSHYPLGDLTLRVCEAAEPTKWAPERWATATMYEHPLGPVAHINVHLNAVVTDVPRNLPRVQAYVHSAINLKRTVQWLQGQGYIVVVTGDVNMSRDNAKDREWAPQTLLGNAGLTVHTHGVEVIAYTRHLDLRRVDVIPRSQTGSDHPFIVATFRDKK